MAKTPKPDRDMQDYGRSVRANVYGLWRGDFQLYDFLDAMELSIQHYFTRAFQAGIANCEMSMSDMEDADLDELRHQIASELQYVVAYSFDILNGSKALKGKFTPLARRVAEWQNRYMYIYNLGTARACESQRLEWVMGPTKEHCQDCLMLAGRVYTAAAWKASGWEPQSRSLSCKGYRCLCRFVPTTLPVTPGHVPYMKELHEHSHHLHEVAYG